MKLWEWLLFLVCIIMLVAIAVSAFFILCGHGCDLAGGRLGALPVRCSRLDQGVGHDILLPMWAGPMMEGITVVALDLSHWTMHPPRVAEGVIGYTHIVEGDLWVMLLIAKPPGEGHVGRYLDELVKGDQRVIVVESLNHILTGMLERRGFTYSTTMMPPPINDVVDVMVYG